MSAQENAREQARWAEHELDAARSSLTGVTDYSPDAASRRRAADRAINRALVHATLAVAYSNMEE